MRQCSVKWRALVMGDLFASSLYLCGVCHCHVECTSLYFGRIWYSSLSLGRGKVENTAIHMHELVTETFYCAIAVHLNERLAVAAHLALAGMDVFLFCFAAVSCWHRWWAYFKVKSPFVASIPLLCCKLLEGEMLPLSLEDGFNRYRVCNLWVVGWVGGFGEDRCV